jgi:hypothetical protein
VKETGVGPKRAILEIAHRCLKRGEIYLATDMYQRIMQRQPRTPEGQEARGKIIEIAQHHEANGRKYMALSLYEKIAAFPDVQKFAPDNEIIGGGAKRSRENVLSADKARSNHKGERPGIKQEAMKEIPFVDLTETVSIKQNFARLGQVQRRVADHSGTVATLKKLMPDHS